MTEVFYGLEDVPEQEEKSETEEEERFVKCGGCCICFQTQNTQKQKQKSIHNWRFFQWHFFCV